MPGATITFLARLLGQVVFRDLLLCDGNALEDEIPVNQMLAQLILKSHIDQRANPLWSKDSPRGLRSQDDSLIPCKCRLGLKSLLDHRAQIVRDRGGGHGLAHLRQFLFDGLLNDGALARALVGVSQDLIVGDDLLDAVVVELPLNPKFWKLDRIFC